MNVVRAAIDRGKLTIVRNVSTARIVLFALASVCFRPLAKFGHINRERERETERETERQRDTDRQTDRQTEAKRLNFNTQGQERIL